jgi:4-amino-4-deoxy-L-arabinose transferase-like glycosyltransferase
VLDSKQRILTFSGIFALALLVRVVVVHLFYVVPINDLLWNDAVAWNLVQGNGYTATLTEPRVPGIFRTPGYPAFLAVVYYFFGHSYYSAYVANAVLDSLTAVLIGLICLNYASVTLSLLTAVLYALYPYPALFCPALHQDILLTFSVICSLFLLSKAIKHEHSPWLWLFVGIMVGITTVIKANLILFIAVPAITLLFNLSHLRRKISYLSLLLLGVCLVIGPWIIRNYIVFKSFPPLAVGGTGTNLMYLVTEVNEGEDALLKKITGRPPAFNINGFVDGKQLIVSEKQLSISAIQQLQKVWPKYLVVIIKHIPRLWISRYTVWHGNVMRFAGIVVSLLFLISGLIGMLLLRKHWRSLLPFYLTIIVITLTYAMYTVEARYTLPARPIMMFFVGYSLLVLIGRKNLAELDIPIRAK